MMIDTPASARPCLASVSLPIVLTVTTLILWPATIGAQEADRVDAIFAEFSTDGSPGCSVAASRGDQLLFNRGYGLASLEHGVPNTPSTVFEAGSVAKQFAAAAILLLVQDGSLALHDAVRSYVPELPDYGARITIDHLLTHTSGFREWGEVADLGGWSPREHVDVVEILSRQRSLNFEPGTQFGYVGSGFTLAAIIVERVTGISLAQFSRQRIFEPLGMTSTEWRDDYRRVVKGRATAYLPSDSSYRQFMPPERNIYGHGGLWTTTGDLIRWNMALADARLGRLVSAELQRESSLSNGTPTGYARGVFVGMYNGRREIHHDGGYAAYRAWLASYPESEVSIALLCNTVTSNVITLGRRVTDLLIPAPPGDEYIQSSPSPDPEAATTTLSQSLLYTGVFVSDKTGLPITVGRRGDQLEADGYPLRHIAPGRFRASWGDLIYESADVITLVRRNGERISLRRAAGPPLTEEELSALERIYHSEEALGSYLASIENGLLVLRLLGQPSHTYTLDPIARDLFAMPNIVVRFKRDSDDLVTSFEITVPRVRRMEFGAVRPRTEHEFD